MAGRFGSMMQTFARMKSSLATLSFVGRAEGDAVIVTMGKKGDMSTYCKDLRINAALLNAEPVDLSKIGKLVQVALNDALAKEMNEIFRALPPEALQKMDEAMKEMGPRQ